MRYGQVAAVAVLSLSIIWLSQRAIAQQGVGCTIGRPVVDDRGGPGTIVGSSASGTRCLVKYQDGRLQAWVAIDQLHDAPEKSVAPESGSDAETPPIPQPVTPEGPIILRPALIHQAVYPADALGHVTLTARINGMQVPFLVDTGASLVGLTPDDAKAAGIDPSQLTFNQTVHTANGTVRAASAQIREIRLDELEVDDVPAVVVESLKQSVLGMSFLTRLKAFDMHNGALTMSW